MNKTGEYLKPIWEKKFKSNKVKNVYLGLTSIKHPYTLYLEVETFPHMTYSGKKLLIYEVPQEFHIQIDYYLQGKYSKMWLGIPKQSSSVSSIWKIITRHRDALHKFIYKLRILNLVTENWEPPSEWVQSAELEFKPDKKEYLCS